MTRSREPHASIVVPCYNHSHYLRECLESGTASHLGSLARDLEENVTGLRDGEQHYWAATYLAYCGHTDRALRLLRLAVSRNYCGYPMMDMDPLLVNVREIPAFAQIRAAAKDCQEAFLNHRARGSR